MRNKLLVWIAFLIFMQIISFLYAETVDILGMQIPLIEGAKLVKDEQEGSLKAKMVNYTVEKPLNEVVGFYQSFLETNGFRIIGGLEEGGSFNASVKRNDIQFCIRIYAQDGLTRIQFIR